jgi:hypothetical protein
MAPLAPYSNASRGYVVGKPLKFVNGHAARMPRAKLVYREADRGYASVCWAWEKPVQRDGYGRSGGGSKTAHRAAYEQFVGPIPKGHVLHHLCGQRDCVRPDHLQPMTRADHLRLHRRIDPALIEAIREATGSQRAVASQFGVSQSLVWNIRNHRAPY